MFIRCLREIPYVSSDSPTHGLFLFTNFQIEIIIALLRGYASPAATWAVYEAKGKLSEAIQDTCKKYIPSGFPIQDIICVITLYLSTTQC